MQKKAALKQVFSAKRLRNKGFQSCVDANHKRVGQHIHNHVPDSDSWKLSWVLQVADEEYVDLFLDVHHKEADDEGKRKPRKFTQ